MRKLRQFLKFLVPAIGMALVIGAVLFGERMVIQLFLVVAGLLLTEAGMWRLAEPVLPDQREYTALRAETDHFMTLVRQLNATALTRARGDQEGADFAFDEVRTAMHRSVDRMVKFAGKTVDEVPPSAAGAAADRKDARSTGPAE